MNNTKNTQERLVKCIMSDDEMNSKIALEKLLKEKCAKRIKTALFQSK